MAPHGTVQVETPAVIEYRCSREIRECSKRNENRERKAIAELDSATLNAELQTALPYAHTRSQSDQNGSCSQEDSESLSSSSSSSSNSFEGGPGFHLLEASSSSCSLAENIDEEDWQKDTRETPAKPDTFLEGNTEQSVLTRRRFSEDSGDAACIQKDGNEEPQSVVVEPQHWTERQVMLAKLGPLKCPGVTASECIWWSLVRARSVFLLCTIYAIQYFVSTMLLLPVLFLERHYAILVYCVYTAAWGFIFIHRPEKHGRAESPAFQKWFNKFMEELSVLHLNGGLRIIRDGGAKFEENQRYVFGYHPHGLMPAILAWFPTTNAWRQLFNGVRPIGLVATAVFRVPVMRDLNLLGGLRDVSRSSFARAIDEKKAVVVCPGGQSELALHQHSSRKQLVLCGRKTGFIRMAMEKGANLVPILVFGEAQLLDNLFEFPSAQNFTYKLLGFPLPFLPLGMFGFLPIPRRGKVALVVGAPFDPSKLCASRAFTPDDVAKVQEEYFKRVEGLFESYHKELGYHDWSLVIKRTG